MGETFSPRDRRPHSVAAANRDMRAEAAAGLHSSGFDVTASTSCGSRSAAAGTARRCRGAGGTAGRRRRRVSGYAANCRRPSSGS